MKKVGIIGGLGPETTAKFYLKLIDKYKTINLEFRPEVLINSVPMELAVEEAFINGEDKSQEYIKLLVDSAVSLENAGADFLVIPCNTVHLFINEVRHSVKIPVLSIVEESVKFLVKHKINRIGLLATKNTIDSKLYHSLLEESKISIEIPEEEDQGKIGKLVNKLVRNEYSVSDKQGLVDIIEKLSQEDIETILLACTDLQLLAPSHPKVAIYDTMKVLVDATAMRIK